MLRRLYIKNFTIIDLLDIQLDGGFSVITGETGAGKSIILGALGLLLGQRADSKTVKTGHDRCVIEAHFDLSNYDMKGFFDENDLDYDDGDCILRRELTSAGKSRAFINDTPVALTTLRELGGQLVDIHSQHQNLLLNKEDFQLSVVDIIASDSILLEDYRHSYLDYKKAVQETERLRDAIQKNKENEDFLRFQFHELEEAQLTDGEQEELEQECQLLEHAEEIKGALFESDNILSADGGVVEQLKRACHSLDSIRRVYPAVEDMVNRLESTLIEAKDIAGEVSLQAERIDFDPARMEEVNARLDTIYRLQKKYHADSITQLNTLKEEIGQQLSQIDGGDESLQEMEARQQQLQTECEAKASRLTAIRTTAAKKVEEEMRQRLIPLGIPKVRFEVSLSPKPLGDSGHDKVSFLFTANTSSPLQPVSQVASGGEIARVMLSLKAMISGAVKLPTIIFDEIDTGVSGKVAEMMARIMQEMGNHDRQVISITHLPQIAARGSAHYRVFKEENDDGTVSRMRRLTHEERVEEIAQMLSGSDITEAAIRNAQELLRNEA